MTTGIYSFTQPRVLGNAAYMLSKQVFLKVHPNHHNLANEHANRPYLRSTGEETLGIGFSNL